MQYYMYISVISYMLLLCISYTYVMQYYIIYVITTGGSLVQRTFSFASFLYVQFVHPLPAKGINTISNVDFLIV